MIVFLLVSSGLRNQIAQLKNQDTDGMISGTNSDKRRGTQTKCKAEAFTASLKRDLSHYWASPVAQLVKNLPAVWETWDGKTPRRRDRLPTPVFWPGEFHGLYSPWGLKESDMTEQLSHTHTYTGSFNFVYHYDEVCGIVWASQLVLVVKKLPANAGDMGLILGSGRFPGGGHDNPVQYACLENPHGQRSLAGYSPWGRKELDTTEQLSRHACTWHCIWPSFHNRDSDFSKLCFLSLTTSRNKTWAGVFAGILFNAFLS